MEQQNVLPIVEERSERIVIGALNEAKAILIKIMSEEPKNPFDICWALLAFEKDKEYRVHSVVHSSVNQLYDWCLQKKYASKRDMVAHIMAPSILEKYGKKLPSDHMHFVNGIVKEYFEQPADRVYTESFEYLYSIVHNQKEISPEIMEKIITEIKNATENNWFSDIWRCVFGLACLADVGKEEELLQRNIRWIISQVSLGRVSPEDVIVTSWFLVTYLRRIQLRQELQRDMENLRSKVMKEFLNLTQQMKNSLLLAWNETRTLTEMPEIVSIPLYRIGAIEISLLIKTLQSLLPDILICYSSEEREKIREELRKDILTKEKQKMGCLLFIVTCLYAGFMHLFMSYYQNFIVSIIPRAFIQLSLFIYYFIWFLIPPPLILMGVEKLIGRTIFPKKIYDVLLGIIIGIITFIIRVALNIISGI